MRIFALSDLHADFADNWKALQGLSLQDYKNDVVLIAGDVADHLPVIAKTLAHMRARFGRVFYVPGNHELWTYRDDCHSPAKLERILQLCDNLGVCAKPGRVGNLWIVPLLSWYEDSFDEDQSADTESLEAWADYYFCKWPPWIKSAAEYLLSANAPNIKTYDRPVITLSHFLPRRDLLPDVARLTFKGLPRVAGCAALDQQIRAVNSVTHIFGHSHIPCDCLIDGVRYVQSVLGYPSENNLLSECLKLIWSSDT